MPIKGLSPQGVKQQASLKALIEIEGTNKGVRRKMWELGLPTYRWELLNRDLTLLREVKALGETMKYVGLHRFITERLYGEARIPMKTQFQTVLRAEGINLKTGERETRYYTVAHDKEMKREDIEGIARAGLEGKPRYFIVEKIMPIYGRLSPETEVY